MRLASRIRKILLFITYVIFFLFILFFSFRNPVLHWAVKQASEKINEHTGASLAIGTSSFSGISEISMFDISVVPLNGDTLFSADSVSLNLSLVTLLRGIIRVNEINASGIHIAVSCKDTICNYSGFMSHLHKENSEKGANIPNANIEKKYSLLLRRLLDRAFNLAPQKANLRNIELTYRNDTLERSIVVNEFISDERSLSGSIEDKNTMAVWKCNGFFSQKNHLININFYPDSNNSQTLPLLNELTGLAVGFDSLQIKLLGYKWINNEILAKGDFSIKNFTAFHKKISDDTVKISSASFDISFHAGNNYLEIDSTSHAALADISITPFIRFVSDTSKIYSLKIRTEKTPPTSFFASLPQGMFDEVRGIEADGTLQFLMDFSLNDACPDSVVFAAFLKKEKFRLRKLASSDLLKMNDEFVHTVYERGRIVREFMVGPSNPSYTTLDKISPYFINAVLTSEDGNFFFHNGFNEEAFRKSIAANFKAGKFQRGGSTISMQLVKNVFLTRKKTIARKAEEALLVWLIESNHMYTKERMLEVYMNIIELGPDVYGIGEASPFYFGKTPAELTLPEGIFLASLLPRPKWFKYSFDTLGNLKPYLADYYRIVSDFMLKKTLITQEEHDQLLPVVVLKGPALNMVVPTDTIPEEIKEFDFPQMSR